MFGFFDPSAGRTGYEYPRADWITQLRAAGFGAIRWQTLYSYWWAEAFLLDMACPLTDAVVGLRPLG